MFKLPGYLKKFLIISYSFSWILWFFAWWLVSNNSTEILVNHDIVDWSANHVQLIASIISSIATLGPLIGYLVVRKNNKHRLSFEGVQKMLKIFGAFAVSCFLVGVFFSQFELGNLTIGALILPLAYYMVTSATEEFGWRGLLQDYLQKHSKSLWDMSLMMSLFWGPWHYPIVIYIFLQQGLESVAILFSLIGFQFSIALMSQLHGWIRLRYKGIWPNFLLHGLHNWWPVVLLLLFKEGGIFGYAILIGYIIVSISLDKFFPSDSFFKKKK